MGFPVVMPDTAQEIVCMVAWLVNYVAEVLSDEIIIHVNKYQKQYPAIASDFFNHLQSSVRLLTNMGHIKVVFHIYHSGLLYSGYVHGHQFKHLE